MKSKILQIIRSSKIYEVFRKVRFYLHLIPAWHWFKGFVKHYFGGLYDRTDRHHLFLLSGGLAFSLFVCIIPMTLIIFWLLGKFLNSAEVELQIITLIDTTSSTSLKSRMQNMIACFVNSNNWKGSIPKWLLPILQHNASALPH